MTDLFLLVREIGVWYIILRCAVDISFLLWPGFSAFANKYGYPVNQFWARTVLPIVAVMLVLNINSLANGPSHEMLSLDLVVPLGWALLLYKEKKSKWMILDSVSWALVAIAGTLFNYPVFLIN